jgi:malate/lactate dehydrogenase
MVTTADIRVIGASIVDRQSAAALGAARVSSEVIRRWVGEQRRWRTLARRCALAAPAEHRRARQFA